MPPVMAILAVIMSMATSVSAEPFRPRAECLAIAQAQAGLEQAGARQLLDMAPQEVQSQYGAAGIERVRRYIELREQLLFQCPRHVLNANVAPIDERRRFKPPIPAKNPVKRVRRPTVRRSTVPLPVQRDSRLQVPTSIG